jgi:myo-inositol-1(or 4)-monophosphatase
LGRFGWFGRLTVRVVELDVTDRDIPTADQTTNQTPGSGSELDDALETAIQAARVAGDILMSWRDRFSVTEKSRRDVVTEADLESQQAIASLLSTRFPDHGLLGEEDLVQDAADGQCRWIIDPLDGTGNYVHGVPYFAVSIALEVQGELEVAVVLDPSHDELFTARRGQGAWLNSTPISVSSESVTDLDNALVTASLPVGISSADHPAVDRFLRVLVSAQHTQRTGSAALNLAYVAAGRLDAFFSTTLKPWDMAAGTLLVREAGGQVTAIDGGRFDVDVADLLASNATPLHKQLSQLM